jgi:hypothetical protein
MDRVDAPVAMMEVVNGVEYAVGEINRCFWARKLNVEDWSLASPNAHLLLSFRTKKQTLSDHNNNNRSQAATMTNLQAPDPITSRSNIDFVEFGVVEAVVPAATNVDLQDLFEAWDGDIPEDSTSMVPFIDQRQFLLLGTHGATHYMRSCCSHTHCRH